ncbi:MAG: signal transduction histidine kinase [Candidatus Omnitrophota bacterium]
MACNVLFLTESQKGTASNMVTEPPLSSQSIDLLTQPTVLVVDDDITLCTLAEEFLKNEGFTVLTAENGKDAIEIFNEENPDVVLLDVMLPDANGIDLCRKIRALPEGEFTQILIMTSLDDEDSINQAYEAGATEFTVKPINWFVESHRIRYMLRNLRIQQELMLSEEQFRQAQKMEAIGRLAGGVAHDFNNLLTIIINYSEIILHGLHTGDKVLEDIAEIKNTAHRAESLTRQLLAFSRKQIVTPQVININQMIDSMQKMLSRLIPPDIDFQTRLDPDLWQVCMDPGQIEQVLVNLVVNAVDAMSGGGKLVITTGNDDPDQPSMRTRMKVAPDNCVLIQISDTGIGMGDLTKAQIFEPFFTTKEVGKGTGLGLATVYGIVKQSKGMVYVESSPGKGTTFNILLPSTQKSVPKIEGTESDVESSSSECTIIAEDEENIRELLSRYLTSKGFSVFEAGNGEEALELIRNTPDVSLLVTDLVMPGMGGYELDEAARAILPQLRTVYMSGYTEHVPSEDQLKASNSIFVQKPFSLDIIYRKIRQLLDTTATP